MPLKRVYQELANLRNERQDFNNFGAYEWANLALAINRFVAPQTGRVYRGGAVRQNASPDLNVRVSTLAAMSPNGELILVETEQTVACPAAPGSGNDRIDLLVIQYGTANKPDAKESRWHWVPGSPGSAQELDVYTRVEAGYTFIVRQGTPGPTPSAPAAQANDVPLATIYRTAGSTTITTADIAEVAAGRANPFRLASFEGSGVSPYDLVANGPLVTASILNGVETPIGQVTYFAARVLVTGSASEFGTGGSGPRTMAVVIEDAGDGTRVGHTVRGLRAYEQADVVVMGFRAGPTTGARDYRIRIEEPQGGAVGNAPTIAFPASRKIAAGASTVSTGNFIASLTL